MLEQYPKPYNQACPDFAGRAPSTLLANAKSRFLSKKPRPTRYRATNAHYTGRTAETYSDSSSGFLDIHRRNRSQRRGDPFVGFLAPGDTGLSFFEWQIGGA